MNVSCTGMCFVLSILAIFSLCAGCAQQPSSTAESASAASTSDVAVVERDTADAPTREAAIVPPKKETALEMPTPAETFVDVTSGTQFEVELLDTLSSGRNQVGDPVRGRLVRPLVADGQRIAPAGSEVHGIVTEVVPLKKFGGQPQIALMFESLDVDERTRLPVKASHRAAGAKQAGRDAAKIGGGVVAGAVIGHQVDDDKGKEIGAVVGGAIGTAIAATSGKEIELSSGTTITVVLEDDLHVRSGS